MDQSICPRCQKSSSATSNRLIKENCGHVKCRECFINDTDGCLDCMNESATDSRLQESRNILEVPAITFDDDQLNDLESNSGDLFIDTEVEDSIFDTNISATPDQTESTDLQRTNNEMHNYSQQNGSEAYTKECKENIKILEQYIIPPKSKIEQIFRETITERVTEETDKTALSHIVSLGIVDKDGGTGPLYECRICKKKFRSWSQRYYHLHCDNDENKPHKCKICLRNFSTTSHLNYHMDTHNRKNKFTCSLCSKVLLNLSSFRRHKKIHEGVYKFKCNECGLAFRERASFAAHMNKHRNIVPFVCKVCGKKFSFKSNLTQHQKIHSGPIKRYKCDDCGKEFARKNSFKEHIIRHSKVKKFKCQACQKLFIDRKTLERHMGTHGSAVYKCPRCDIQCVRKDNLVRHVRNMHTTEDIPEILKNIKISIDPNNETNAITEPPTTLDNKTPINDSPPETQSHQIVISSSVIRSVGNVKPVHIPTDCVLEVSVPQINSLPSNSTESSNKESSLTMTTTTTTNPTTIETKKPKKKYDPSEIYRKILFANDTDDSVLETEELYSDSKDDHVGCCKPAANNESEIPNENSNVKSVNSTEQFSFTEMHWRKRTSQSFHAT